MKARRIYNFRQLPNSYRRNIHDLFLFDITLCHHGSNILAYSGTQIMVNICICNKNGPRRGCLVLEIMIIARHNKYVAGENKNPKSFQVGSPSLLRSPHEQ